MTPEALQKLHDDMKAMCEAQPELSSLITEAEMVGELAQRAAAELTPERFTDEQRSEVTKVIRATIAVVLAIAVEGSG